MNPILLTLYISLLCLPTVNSFLMTPWNTNGIRVTSERWTTSEDGNPSDTTSTSTTEAAAAAAASDILNSPAFLQRKLEVLKSDDAAMDEQIVAAKAQLEEQKMEWEPQFDALEKEVCKVWIFHNCVYI
jgi:hypothetical protein